MFRRRRHHPESRLIREGDSYERGEAVNLDRVPADPYPDGQVDEPYPGMTTKTPDRWMDTADPATWRDDGSRL